MCNLLKVVSMQNVFSDVSQEEIMKCLYFHASISQVGKSREDMTSELVKMLEGSESIAFNNASYAELRSILQKVSLAQRTTPNAMMGMMPAGG